MAGIIMFLSAYIVFVLYETCDSYSILLVSNCCRVNLKIAGDIILEANTLSSVFPTSL